MNWDFPFSSSITCHMLFTVAALARQAGVDPEQALQKRNAAFLAEHAGRAENQES